jgi:hypothetical protein
LEKDASADSLVAWWPTWFAFAPADAFAFLEAWAAQNAGGKPPTPPSSDEESLPLPADRAPDPDSALFAVISSMTTTAIETGLLSRVVRMLLECVPHSGDVRHRGIYSPSLRDNVQRTRDAAMLHLAERRGAAAHHALMELAGHSSGELGEWFAHRARLRAEADSEPDRWVEGDVATFTDRFLRVPRTSVELFEVTLGRLRDVRRYLEGGDFSVKDVYLDQHECDLQRLLAHDLELRAHGCYSVHREGEVIDQKLTDIRLRTGSDAVVTLEVKRAQEYSVAELERGLEDQLVGQYMRDHGSRFGIFVLCHNGKPEKQWDAPGGGRWSLEQVVDHLTARALVLVATNPQVLGLQIVSIDFFCSAQ